MTPSDYEKFQQQIFDQLDDLEQADKQSEMRKVVRSAISKLIEDAKRQGINLDIERLC